MTKTCFDPVTDGFYGIFYPNQKESNAAIIAMMGDSCDDYMAVRAAKWLQETGCHVMAMSPAKHDYSHHNYPLERFGCAIEWLRAKGIEKIGITGASTTAMLALIASSYFSEITLTIAFSPSDFVMEGFYQDGLDGVNERPGVNESTVSWHGNPLPYLPFAYRHPIYWHKLREESKAGGNMIASRKMFDFSEMLHPVTEKETIKTERIKGDVLLIGAEDDCLWDTCRYIRRIEKRLSALPHEGSFEYLTYEHGTHFIFPQSMLKKILPAGSGLLVKAAFKAARENPSECLETRKDIDKKVKSAIYRWLNN